MDVYFKGNYTSGTLFNTLFDLAILIVVAKGASLNAAFEGAGSGALEAVEGADTGGAPDGAEAHALEVVEGGGFSLVHALKLRSAPISVVGSFLVLYAWGTTMLGMQ